MFTVCFSTATNASRRQPMEFSVSRAGIAKPGQKSIDGLPLERHDELVALQLLEADDVGAVPADQGAARPARTRPDAIPGRLPSPEVWLRRAC